MRINEVIEHITNGTGGGKAHLEAIRYLEEYKRVKEILKCAEECNASGDVCFHCMDKKIEKAERIIKE